MLQRLILILSLSLITPFVILNAAIEDIVPSAPVKDFRFPRFGENGYTRWVLQGSEGIYDSEEKIRVNGMELRIYTGDERMAIEMSLDSPQATLHLKEDKAYSDDVIEVAGRNFKMNGIGWEWQGATREIEVKGNAVVEFAQSISNIVSSASGNLKVPVRQKTVIQSQGLKLQTTKESYYFNFSGDVHVISADMHLKCNHLTVFAGAPESQSQEMTELVDRKQLKSLREIRAQGNVTITQGDRSIRAGSANFFPEEELATLHDAPSVRISGIHVTGEDIRIKKGEIEMTGSKDSSRAQIVLTGTSGLRIQETSELSSETTVVADNIRILDSGSENQFMMDGSVEVMSGSLLMRSDKMIVLAHKVSEPTEEENASQNIDKKLNMGKMHQLIAQDNVYIEQDGQIATSDKAVFYPLEERAVLTGDLTVSNDTAAIAGQVMVLKQGSAWVEGSPENPVSVILPALPDLGYPETKSSVDEGAAVIESEMTMILSHIVHMNKEAEQTRFAFHENVQVSATNLKATCGRLHVIAGEKEMAIISQRNTSDNKGGSFQLERIEANEAVTIEQSGRTAKARQALILPQEGRVVLEGNAVVIDGEERISGHRLILDKEQKRAIIEGGEGKRARMTLPELESGEL